MKFFFQAALVWMVSSYAFSQSAEHLVSTVRLFRSTLSEDELKTALYVFEDTLRDKWTNLPVGMAARPGIRYGDLSEDSKIRFHDVLTTVLSSQGYLKTHNIMHLDDYLLEIYEIAYERNQLEERVIKQLRTLSWGYGNYYVSLWGIPDVDEPWGLKLEGHHISLNITSTNGEIAVTPLFLGTDPALVRVTQFAGMRPLSKEEDYGLELINMLTPDQQKIAVISDEFPRDIITSPGKPQRLTAYQGIKGSELNEVQKKQLHYLIQEYVQNFEREKADYYLKRISEKGVEDIFFGWIGGTKRERNHYYVIHGPDFIIEYDNAGWSQEGDHIHSIFRDKKNDFGEDLLKAHYLQHPHQVSIDE